MSYENRRPRPTYMKHATPGEREVGRRLVEALWSREEVKVIMLDGGGYDYDAVVNREVEGDKDHLYSELTACGCQRLLIVGQDEARLGWVSLVWGSDPDGSELIADYSANDWTEGLIEGLS